MSDLPLSPIEDELTGLRVRLLWIVGAAATLGVVFAFVIAGASLGPSRTLLRTSREAAQGDAGAAYVDRAAPGGDLVYHVRAVGRNRLESAPSAEAIWGSRSGRPAFLPLLLR